MALIDKLFGKKVKTLSELTVGELRRQEIMIGKDRDKMFKRIEMIATEKQKIFQQGAQQKSPELRKALAMQFELKTQEQMLAGRQLNVRSKELLTISRVRMVRENAPKMSGALGRLNLNDKDVGRIEQWISDDAVNEEMYLERLNGVLDLGLQSDKDAAAGSKLSEPGQELMDIWSDLDRGNIKEDQAFENADKAVRGKQGGGEKSL